MNDDRAQMPSLNFSGAINIQTNHSGMALGTNNNIPDHRMSSATLTDSDSTAPVDQKQMGMSSVNASEAAAVPPRESEQIEPAMLQQMVTARLRTVLSEEGVEILTEYIWHMLLDTAVTAEHMAAELNEFLNDKTDEFVTWLVHTIVPHTAQRQNFNSSESAKKAAKVESKLFHNRHLITDTEMSYTDKVKSDDRVAYGQKGDSSKMSPQSKESHRSRMLGLAVRQANHSGVPLSYSSHKEDRYRPHPTSWLSHPNDRRRMMRESSSYDQGYSSAPSNRSYHEDGPYGSGNWKGHHGFKDWSEGGWGSGSRRRNSGGYRWMHRPSSRSRSRADERYGSREYNRHGYDSHYAVMSDDASMDGRMMRSSSRRRRVLGDGGKTKNPSNRFFGYGMDDRDDDFRVVSGRHNLSHYPVADGSMQKSGARHPSDTIEKKSQPYYANRYRDVSHHDDESDIRKDAVMNDRRSHDMERDVEGRSSQFAADSIEDPNYSNSEMGPESGSSLSKSGNRKGTSNAGGQSSSGNRAILRPNPMYASENAFMNDEFDDITNGTMDADAQFNHKSFHENEYNVYGGGPYRRLGAANMMPPLNTSDFTPYDTNYPMSNPVGALPMRHMQFMPSHPVPMRVMETSAGPQGSNYVVYPHTHPNMSMPGINFKEPVGHVPGILLPPPPPPDLPSSPVDGRQASYGQMSRAAGHSQQNGANGLDVASATSPLNATRGDNAMVDTIINGSGSTLKLKKRCSKYPLCTFGDACRYIHPKEMCTNWPYCRFGVECFYIHPEVPCKYQTNCCDWQCNYHHPESWYTRMKQRNYGYALHDLNTLNYKAARRNAKAVGTFPNLTSTSANSILSTDGAEGAADDTSQILKVTND